MVSTSKGMRGPLCNRLESIGVKSSSELLSFPAAGPWENCVVWVNADIFRVSVYTVAWIWTRKCCGNSSWLFGMWERFP